MFIPCPHCQFLVACPPQRLAEVAGDCPRCGRPLAQESTTATDPVEPPDSVPARSAYIHVALVNAIVEGDAVEPTPVTESVSESESESELKPESESESEPKPEPELELEPEPPAQTAQDAAASGPMPVPVPEPAPAPTAFAARTRSTVWARLRWPLIALLALLLGLQMLLADRARLAADPGWRPLLETLCGTLGCALPAWHEPVAFTMLDRQVRPTPHAGTLRVDATFRNDARWAQDWPALQLALSDADGRVLGSHVFVPAHYLGAAPTTVLSPGQSAQVSFLVQEPAPGTVAFSFQFR